MASEHFDVRNIDPKSLALPALAFAGGAILGLMGVKALLRGTIAAATVVGLINRTEMLPATAPATRRPATRAARRRTATKKSA
jgi:hypothetical protein